MFNIEERRRRQNHLHPYLSGNFAPVHQERSLTPCSFTGTIPSELAGGQYIRNGGNPVTNEDLGREAHWFDGDGMLSGVLFRRNGEKDLDLLPEFVNQYILTDVYLSSKASHSLQTPILPSIATLVNPLSSLFTIIVRILRTILLVLLSHLPGSQQAIKKISVANTAVMYHDGRALATCESGPPIRIALPSLDTIGWFNGKKAEGEPNLEAGSGFGGDGLLGFMKEWTTAHPRVDRTTSEFISFHSTFVPPYVHYSIIPSTKDHDTDAPLLNHLRLLTAPVSGISSAKMMHDFGVSRLHTVIMDLPLSLDPLNLARNKPVVSYDPTSNSRFGVFPRYQPDHVRWFETNACCIFHTANTWDSMDAEPETGVQFTSAVNMLVCRLTSASLVFSAGDLAAPIPSNPIPLAIQEDEQCRLYYYKFALTQKSSQSRFHANNQNTITHQWALSAIPFEFPTTRDSVAMSAAKYVYGCSVSDSSFGAALGRAVKIDSLVKMNVEELVRRGIRNPPESVKGCVDSRTVPEVLASHDPKDPIQVFTMPRGWYAQESRFIPKKDDESEDDGWLLTYVFDESQLDVHGECEAWARSELWIIDSRTMKDTVAKIQLPQRVPYGLHGNWFSENEIQGQRPINGVRHLPSSKGSQACGSPAWRMWMKTRRMIEEYLE